MILAQIVVIPAQNHIHDQLLGCVNLVELVAASTCVNNATSAALDVQPESDDTWSHMSVGRTAAELSAENRRRK